MRTGFPPHQAEKIRKLNKQISFCGDCPYGIITLKSKKMMKNYGNKVLFIGQFETRADEVFFENMVEESGVKVEEISFTNVSKNPIPHGSILQDIEWDHLLEHLLQEIITVKPKQIITLGVLARKPFGLKKVGDSRVTDFIETDKYGNKTGVFRTLVTATFHPKEVEKKVITRGVFIQMLKQCYYVRERQDQRLA